jgi:hypothetical protein
MTKRKKGPCLTDAANYPIWWLRFCVDARASGFDRIIKHREGYSDVVKEEAMIARMKSAKLHKEDDDIERSGGETFDTPRTPTRELEMDSDCSNDGSEDPSNSSGDNSSGLESIATSSSIGSGGKNKKKKRTIESKVIRKNKKLFDLIVKSVSDEIAMTIQRKANQDGCGALREIERKYASSDSTRRKHLAEIGNEFSRSFSLWLLQ